MTSLALAEGVIELEERSPDDFEPNDQETCDYAKFLGIDPEFDMDLLYLAKEGLKAPLPVGWKPCQNSEGNIFYFNTENGKSSWNHPADEEYKQKVKDIKAQRAGGNRCEVVSSNSSRQSPRSASMPRCKCFRRWPCCRRRYVQVDSRESVSSRH
mmetsp:Transcript_82872/g.130614  ORF Transcript_82872/g.130614 Transcript_82872/m.130614 type:complete len:155 (-) Transcript_82872:82-546(-)